MTESPPQHNAAAWGHRTYDVLGIDISVTSIASAARRIIESAHAGQGLQVHLCNTYTLSLVSRDARLRSVLECADMNLPDGTPIAWLGRRHGVNAPVRGPSLMTATLQLGLASGVRHYFYGGAPGVASDLARAITKQLPGVRVVGSESPPFADPTASSMQETAERIRSAAAEIIWVGLGTPRQDYAVPLLADHVQAPIVPVGAAFDFLSGRVRQAPEFLHGTGTEWLYRLARDPRRLWRRYTFGNAQFVWSLARYTGRELMIRRRPRGRGTA